MNLHYSSQPIETISIEVESSQVWEVILGITGFTHTQLRHTFEFDEMWESNLDSMSEILLKYLDEIERTNLWYGLILLQERFSAKSITDFSLQLSEMNPNEFYETVLPYKDREMEPMRREISAQYKQGDSFESYASYFNDHAYLGEYIRHLGSYSYQEICTLFINLMTDWYTWIRQNEKWEKWIRTLDFEEKQYNSLDKNNPIETIELITGGVRYFPEPSVWTVKLIPQVIYRPWTLEVRTPDTKLYFYPLKEEYLTEPGVPSAELIRGHKALGDEVRLKILYQLVKESSSLQDLSLQFSISKTTLHHQLSLLKAAKFIQVDKGIYKANMTRINAFSERLTQYLGDTI
ncbi:winged helix-turn-helix domain-containing protein [Paenisporosarcina sp. FSL H8-0542]|uniref:ArsR/SmtB family transcription factor n=1 Tax=unclassified Paenisporosarcina TaxID=2642018 RepID=UPI00034E8B19|nr:winged helix-turn-helix domain-containing protein [Paenisporosarcina sp. HGH0030]EPD51552.1 hypothetical protein HMPREF1210_02150 [Paenisporosarcina sp. HGH0030]